MSKIEERVVFLSDADRRAFLKEVMTNNTDEFHNNKDENSHESKNEPFDKDDEQLDSLVQSSQSLFANREIMMAL